MSSAPAEEPAGARDALPHVVAWNLTRRCNLACSHCYISAGSWHAAAGELSADECRRISDEILELVASPLFVLSGGEPLAREDLEEIASHAAGRGATVVVGTNGTGLSDERIRSLKDSGVTGVAVSIDSLDATYHDRFRHGGGALADTMAAVERLGEHELDFIVQTTLTRGNRDEIESLADWAASKGAVSFNLYFLVETGRGEGMRGLEPRENDEVLKRLVRLEQRHRGRMLVRSKCQPQIMRHVLEMDPDSPLSNYRTRCPCGVQYCRITPEGRLTPCPYLPEVAGDLRKSSFGEVWTGSELLRRIREEAPSGKCGACEYRLACGGCRARAHARTGDVLGPDDSCAHEPTGDVPLVVPGREVTYGAPEERRLTWSPEAEERMRRVPSFVRAVVVRRVEDFARREGLARIDAALLDRVRREMPVDFSKRLPFFARRR